MTTRFPSGITADITGDVTGNVTGNVNNIALGKITETVTYDNFTDGGSTTGTIDLSTTIPVGATVLRCVATAVTGFAGDTSATVQVGDGSDVDRYTTGTPDVFSDIAAGLDLGAVSGTGYHATAATVTVTVTTAADFTSVSAGSLTLEITYIS